jgi:hypothetical protein
MLKPLLDGSGKSNIPQDEDSLLESATNSTDNNLILPRVNLEDNKQPSYPTSNVMGM